MQIVESAKARSHISGLFDKLILELCVHDFVWETSSRASQRQTDSLRLCAKSIYRSKSCKDSNVHLELKIY